MFQVKHAPLAAARNIVLVSELTFENQSGVCLSLRKLRVAIMNLLSHELSDMHLLLDDLLVVFWESSHLGTHSIVFRINAELKADLAVGDL